MPPFTLKSKKFLDTPDRKRRFNEALFTAIAREYGWMTQVLSFGRDRGWKRELIDALPAGGRPVCADLACGNGELTRLLAQKYPGGLVVGLDLTEAMLMEARRHQGGAAVRYRRADMCATGLPSASQDIVTAGYALRNAPRLEDAVDEIVRILKPGGTAAILEFSRPDAKAGQWLERAALRAWGAFWGLVRTRNPDTYRYIADSLDRFPPQSEFHELLRGSGLIPKHTWRRFFGVIEIVLAQKEPSP